MEIHTYLEIDVYAVADEENGGVGGGVGVDNGAPAPIKKRMRDKVAWLCGLQVKKPSEKERIIHSTQQHKGMQNDKAMQ